MNARRAGIEENERRRRTDQLEHAMGEIANLPLRPVAATQLEEMQKLAHVHRDDYLGLGGVGQKIARIFGGNPQLNQACVGIFSLLDSLIDCWLQLAKRWRTS